MNYYVFFQNRISLDIPDMPFGNITDNGKKINITTIDGPLNDFNVKVDLDYLAENMDRIVSRIMLRSIYDNDVIKFERERVLQKMLFGNLIKFVKLAKNKFGMTFDENSGGT